MDYQELVKKYHKVKSIENKIIGKINDNFLEYYKQNNLISIKEIEKYLKSEIKKIYCLEYKGNYGEFADVVEITTASDIKTFIVSQGEEWEDGGEGFITVEDIADETGNNDIMYIIKNIYEEYAKNGVYITAYV
jgi:hypothetical protein